MLNVLTKTASASQMFSLVYADVVRAHSGVSTGRATTCAHTETRAWMSEAGNFQGPLCSSFSLLQIYITDFP